MPCDSLSKESANPLASRNVGLKVDLGGPGRAHSGRVEAAVAAVDPVPPNPAEDEPATDDAMDALLAVISLISSSHCMRSTFMPSSLSTPRLCWSVNDQLRRAMPVARSAWSLLILAPMVAWRLFLLASPLPTVAHSPMGFGVAPAPLPGLSPPSAQLHSTADWGAQPIRMWEVLACGT